MKDYYSFLERIALSAKRLMLPLAFVAGMGVVSQACDGNNSNNNGGGDPETVQVTGSATDGPYIDGSKVTIVQLDSAFNPTDKTIIQWTDSLGRYSAELPAKTNFKASISGFHFDEIAGQPSEAPIDLLASFRTGVVPDEYNINDVTHLVADRILHLAETDPGRTFSEYSSTARDEFFSELDMMIVGSGVCHPHEMDVISGSSTCNDPLLGVELLFRQYAHDVANATGAAVAPTLQGFFNNSALYFGQTGTLPNDVKDGLRAAALNLDVSAATLNLQAYLDAQGELAETPNADNVLDQDMDGIVNSLDEDIDGDGVLNEDDTDPRNPSVGAGVYIDPVSGLIWQQEGPSDLYDQPSAIAYCDALDHAGFDDWRLPNIDDLRSLVRGCPDSETGGACEVTEACSEMSCFTDICLGCDEGLGPADSCYQPVELDGDCTIYTSTSVRSDLPEIPWVIDFTTANIANITSPILPYNVRCVRNP